MTPNGIGTRYVLRLIAIAGALGVASAASAENLVPPNEQGPFNVGVTTFSATMTAGRITRVQVYYPSLAPANCATTYTITTAVGAYQVRSPLCAVRDGPAAPGPFPLVVHDHGSGGAGADVQRVGLLPTHESMASHGFVMVVALHSANAAVRVRDLSVVIDVVLARSATPGDLLSGTIDPTKVGISGISAGGAAALGAAGGWAANGIVADARIKAMALYEPSVLSMADASTIAIPYLVMGGKQSANGRNLPALFDATAEATPRIYVLSPAATHFSYITGMCSEIDQTREAALLADPGLPEPLTYRTPTNAAAARAYDLWNMGEIAFAALGHGAGSGRNMCTRVGVTSSRSLDLSPHDGFTDSPPFMATDGYTLEPTIPSEIMVPLINHFTIAFWKRFLEGDGRYMPYLTPGHAKRNALEAVVTIQ